MQEQTYCVKIRVFQNPRGFSWIFIKFWNHCIMLQSHSWPKTWGLLTCQGKSFWENYDFLYWFFSLWHQYLCPCVKPVDMAGSTCIEEWNPRCWIPLRLSRRSVPHLMMLLTLLFFFFVSFWHAEVDKSGFLKENESVGEYIYTYIYFIYIDKYLYLYLLWWRKE